MSASLDRWLIINYAGYPFSPSSFMPDNGLANLASALINNNKMVEILDFGTVGLLRRIITPYLFNQLKTLWGKIVKAEYTYTSKQVDEIKEIEKLRTKGQILAVRNIITEIIEKIMKERIDCIGFKLWVGDGLKYSTMIAKNIKKHFPKIKIFGGGPQVDIFGELIFKKYNCFDALVYGEGEETIKYLSETGADLKYYASIPNLIFLKNKQIVKTRKKGIDSLDELPLATYDPDIYTCMRNNEKIKIIVLDESRGCKNNCAFCIHPIKSDHNLRVKSVERLIKEIEIFIQKYNIRTFRFAGSCTPYYFLNSFAHEIIKKNINITYSSFAHVRESEKSDFDKLRKSGCIALFFGIESGSPKILKLMNKGIKKEMIYNAINNSKKAGIFTIGSFIFPSPGEDNITEKETMELLDYIKLDAAPIQSPGISPKTDWFYSAKRYNIHMDNPDRYSEKLMNWKVKSLLPPIFWDNLPISIDNRNHKQILYETAEFSKKVEKKGIVTSVSDEIYLMSYKTKTNIQKFRDEMREAIFIGDVPKIENIIFNINTKI